ncbi:hypothetical protein BVRB_5g114990 [Beta vulgaris subsp. vulgaris]|nr:hypothetical protein BVRB_5g114990 [Beta vulgaris subsp. vulgaris]
MEGHWNYLGTAYLRYERLLTLGCLNVSIDPRIFRQFLSSASFETTADIIKHSVLVAILDDPDDEPEFETEVTLSFNYTYIFDHGDDDKIRMNPDNAALITNSEEFDYDILESIDPLNAKFELTPYNAYDYGHQLQVDIDVYYQWKDDHNDEAGIMKNLHIQITQERIPWIPMGTPLEGAWNFLGVDLLRRNVIVSRKLQLKDIEGFLNSFPMGRMRDRILDGYGVRAANAYIYGDVQTIKGLQLKVKDVNRHPRTLALSLGPLLEFNADYRYKWIQVYYRWIGEFLELGFKET